ncbi:MAG: hypothetical protein NTW29_06695 [Bacteroidetes bacterium]|nr:hypothetical protein [Bacteroidota bacterium]
MKKLAFTLLFALAILLTSNMLQAQDTLPKFLVKNAGNNRIVIGWVNTFENITQLSIQRSFDSLSGFKTILTVADPMSPQNGYVDTKAANDHMFYRLYIQLDRGNYIFSNAKKPVLDTAKKTGVTDVLPRVADSIRKVNPFYVKLDSLLKVDSVSSPNAATFKNKPTAFSPSLYVYTARDGYVRITLPDEEKPKKYSIKFYDADETFLFELKDIKSKTFKLDKSSFYHAGWFHFELFEDGKLLEKHKFYLDKDF